MPPKSEMPQPTKNTCDSLHLCGSQPASRGYVSRTVHKQNISSRGRPAATKVQAVSWWVTHQWLSCREKSAHKPSIHATRASVVVRLVATARCPVLLGASMMDAGRFLGATPAPAPAPGPRTRRTSIVCTRRLSYSALWQSLTALLTGFRHAELHYVSCAGRPTVRVLAMDRRAMWTQRAAPAPLRLWAVIFLGAVHKGRPGASPLYTESTRCPVEGGQGLWPRGSLWARHRASTERHSDGRNSRGKGGRVSMEMPSRCVRSR